MAENLPVADRPSNHGTVNVDVEPATDRTHIHVELSRKAANSLKKNSQSELKASTLEEERKYRCLEFEQSVQRSAIDCSELTTPLKMQYGNSKPAVAGTGDFVRVEPDLSRGKQSFGGFG